MCGILQSQYTCVGTSDNCMPKRVAVPHVGDVVCAEGRVNPEICRHAGSRPGRTPIQRHQSYDACKQLSSMHHEEGNHLSISCPLPSSRTMPVLSFVILSPPTPPPPPTPAPARLAEGAICLCAESPQSIKKPGLRCTGAHAALAYFPSCTFCARNPLGLHKPRFS